MSVVGYQPNSPATRPSLLKDTGRGNLWPVLTSVRLKEIVPLYHNLEIRCAAGRALAESAAIKCAEDVIALFGFLEYESRENFFALHLDSKNRILCLDQVSIGSLSASIVHMRDLFKSALLSSASGLVFVHNHPSGDPTPSREDQDLQVRLDQSAELLGIRVLDHLVIGAGGRYASLSHGARCAAMPVGE